jgi:hypothetical protein
MPLRNFLAAALAALAVPAFATPQLRNATDMWFNAAESGWGLNLIHQGDTLFGTLFVYGPDGQPTWYVASGLVGSGTVYSGALSSATGPWFGGAFSAGSVTRRQVGAMTVDVRDGFAIVDYTADGVHVTKQVTRFTFRPTRLTGGRTYMYQPAGAALPEFIREGERFALIDDGATISIDTNSDADSDCQLNGTRTQDGQMVSAAGSYTCGRMRTGDWSMRVDPTPNGFIGSFTGLGVTSPWGRIAEAFTDGSQKLEGNGWRTGMWFAPDESGWGVNIIEQGDTIFATLFVYDAQGRPRWYVASQLGQSGNTAEGTAINSGALYEATGPSFGAPAFDPSAVFRRQVGTMSFQVRSPGSALLTYAIDGVQVAKSVTQFAFRRNDASGTYIGHVTGNGHDQARIMINDPGNGSMAMRISGMYGGSCDYTGSSRQVGEFINGSGTFQCGFGGSGMYVLSNLAVAFDGITGHVELRNVTGFAQNGITTFNLEGVRNIAN